METPTPDLESATAALALEEKIDERVVDAVVSALVGQTPGGYRIVQALYNNTEFRMWLQGALQQQVHAVLQHNRSYWVGDETQPKYY